MIELLELLLRCTGSLELAKVQDPLDAIAVLDHIKKNQLGARNPRGV